MPDYALVSHLHVLSSSLDVWVWVCCAVFATSALYPPLVGPFGLVVQPVWFSLATEEACHDELAFLLLLGCTPPPLSFPIPCRSPGGDGGPSLGQQKNFRCGSLCCCVGDCVVGHCHLYPLHSWRDILLTFAEMELDSTTMFPLGTGQM